VNFPLVSSCQWSKPRSLDTTEVEYWLDEVPNMSLHVSVECQGIYYSCPFFACLPLERMFWEYL
jgi:hypothetical protein